MSAMSDGCFLVTKPALRRLSIHLLVYDWYTCDSTTTRYTDYTMRNHNMLILATCVLYHMCPIVFIALQGHDVIEQHAPPLFTAVGAKLKQQAPEALRNRGMWATCGYARNVLRRWYLKITNLFILFLRPFSSAALLLAMCFYRTEFVNYNLQLQDTNIFLLERT